MATKHWRTKRRVERGIGGGTYESERQYPQQNRRENSGEYKDQHDFYDPLRQRSGSKGHKVPKGGYKGPPGEMS